MADNRLNLDNRNGLRRFGYRYTGNDYACDDFCGFYRAETHHPNNALYRFQGAEMGSYSCRNRIAFGINFLIKNFT